MLEHVEALERVTIRQQREIEALRDELNEALIRLNEHLRTCPAATT